MNHYDKYKVITKLIKYLEDRKDAIDVYSETTLLLKTERTLEDGHYLREMEEEIETVLSVNGLPYYKNIEEIIQALENEKKKTIMPAKQELQKLIKELEELNEKI